MSDVANHMQSGHKCSYTIFQLNDTYYAIDTQVVSEICMWQPLKKMPQADLAILGVLSHKHKAIPIFNLHQFFGMQAIQPTHTHMIILIEMNDMLFGVLVDRVVDVFFAEHFEQIEAHAHVKKGYFLSVFKWRDDIVFILNMNVFFHKSEKIIETATCTTGSKEK